MLPVVRIVPTTSIQAWRLIEKDFTLRLSLVANEWATEHLKAWNAVFAEGRKRGNAAYYGPALVEMEIADADKCAEWYYESCCEIWQIQGRAKSKPFFRAVFDWCLQPMFSTREGCFRHKLDLHQKRTRTRFAHSLSHINGQMKRRMGRLRAEWNTKLEIATRDAENQERVARERESEQKALAIRDIRERRFFEEAFGPRGPSTHSVPEAMSGTERVGAVLSTFSWKELEPRFKDLQARAPQRDCYAMVIRTEWHSGAISEEWIVGGTNLACQKKFEHLASIAAQKLGHEPSDVTYKHWLGRIRAWMQEAGLDKDRNIAWHSIGDVTIDGNTGKTNTLYTEQIAELSAMFCAHLMAHGARESAASSTLKSSDTPENSQKPERNAGRKKSRSPEFERYAGALWKNHQGPNGRVLQGALKEIAANLDQTAFSEPSDHLEARAAKELKTHNQKFGNSPKKLSSWTEIITRGQPSLKQAVRKLLSRCARTSGN